MIRQIAPQLEGDRIMRARWFVGLTLTVLALVPLSAHVIVSPTISKIGATQKYELRIHNEAKVATASVELEIPDGVIVSSVTKPAAGSYATKTSGDRITAITWQIEVGPNKYIALPFVAKNPDAVTELRWTIHEHLADGSVVDWSDQPGSKEKGSITTLRADRQ